MADLQDTGIIDELLAEIKDKDAALAKYKNGHKSIVYFSGPFEIYQTEPLEIRGVFLTEGEWNNDTYPKSICKSLESQIESRNIPVMVEHGKREDFGSKIVGKTTIGEYNETIKGVLGRVEVTDPLAQELIKKKKLRGFSVRGEVDKNPENGKNVVNSFNLFEISLVEDPACDISFVAFSNQLLNKLKESYKEGKLMAEEKTPTGEIEIELSEGQVIALVVMDEEEAKKKKYPYYYGEPGKNKYEYPKKKKKGKSLEELSELYNELISRIEKLEENLAKKKEEEEEEQSGPRSEEERAKAHFKISDAEWDKLTEEKKKAYIAKLPPRGSAEKKQSLLQETPPEPEKKEETPPEKAPETKVETPEPEPEKKEETPPAAKVETPEPVPAPEPEKKEEPTSEELEKLSPGEAMVLAKRAKGTE